MKNAVRRICRFLNGTFSSSSLICEIFSFIRCMKYSYQRHDLYGFKIIKSKFVYALESDVFPLQ